MSRSKSEPPFSVSPADEQALLMIMQGLINSRTRFTTKGRAIVLQTMADASAGNEDAFFALLSLGHVCLVLLGRTQIPSVTADYSEMLMQLMEQRRYTDIVAPEALNNQAELSDVWHNFFESDANNDADAPTQN